MSGGISGIRLLLLRCESLFMCPQRRDGVEEVGVGADPDVEVFVAVRPLHLRVGGVALARSFGDMDLQSLDRLFEVFLLVLLPFRLLPLARLTHLALVL